MEDMCASTDGAVVKSQMTFILAAPAVPKQPETWGPLVMRKPSVSGSSVIAAPLGGNHSGSPICLHMKPPHGPVLHTLAVITYGPSVKLWPYPSDMTSEVKLYTFPGHLLELITPHLRVGNGPNPCTALHV